MAAPANASPCVQLVYPSIRGGSVAKRKNIHKSQKRAPAMSLEKMKGKTQVRKFIKYGIHIREINFSTA